MAQYQATKDLRHDGKIVYSGAVIPQAWIDEWEGYGNNTIAKMRRNGQLQALPDGNDALPEAVPVSLNVGDSVSPAMTSNEKSAVHGLLDKMSEREALEYVRENDMVPDPGDPTGVDPDAVDVEAQWKDDDSEIDENYFDPGEHNIEDVKQFVTENPDAAGDVLDAEAAGKNRATLVRWLEQFLEAQDEEEDAVAEDDDDDDDDA